MKEEDIQKAVCQYLDLRNVLYFAPMNENVYSGILRHYIPRLATKIISSIMNKAKKMGKKKGVLDLFIMQSNMKYGALVIELKTPTTKPTPEQIVWIKRLNQNNYYATVCHSVKEAISIIELYLDNKL
jgi:hypothetical protein